MSSIPPAPPPPPPPSGNSGPSNGSGKRKWAGSEQNPIAAGGNNESVDSDEETMPAEAPNGLGDAPGDPLNKEIVSGGQKPVKKNLTEQRSKSQGKSLPPPPPPRATLPPVRSVSDLARERSGIGSANTRWRGGLPDIKTESEEKTQSAAPGHLAGQDDEDPAESVARSAPSWLLSLVIHLIVLLILALITSPSGNGFKNLVLNFGISDDSIDDAVELDLSSLQSQEVVEASEDAIDDTLVETEIPDVFEPITPTEMEVIVPDLIGESSIEIAKPMFGGRTGAMRKALEAMFGATDDTRDAVKLGLAWLKRQQNRSGYWSMRGPFPNGAVTENQVAATAMALLAFAGDGNTHLEGMYRKEVDSGLKFLISQQDRGGFMARSARDNERTYAQAQATIVLCELYGMTKDSWLRPYAQLAIDYAMKAQNSNGGWRYNPNEPGDTSVTGWYVMAVQSALSSGLEVDPGKVALIDNYLDSASVYNGAGYTYIPGVGDPTPTMTAEGLLCRQYLGWKRDNHAMIDGLTSLRLDWPLDLKSQNVYYWYYATQAFHHFGGEMWTEWNDQMKVKLPALQIKEGDQRGSWAPQKDRWSSAGRLYTTCLSIYCLEVYYRHLPIYKN